MAADRVARGRERADQILALDPSRKASPSIVWSISQSCAGASNAIIRNSSRRSGSGISRDVAGADSITTPPCASQPTASWSPKRETIPPSGHRSTTLFPELAVPDGYQPRGSAATARASHPKLDRNHASTIDRCARQKPATMPMLQLCNRKVVTAQKFMTQ